MPARCFQVPEADLTLSFRDCRLIRRRRCGTSPTASVILSAAKDLVYSRGGARVPRSFAALGMTTITAPGEKIDRL